jgi:hypothetical protein
VIISHEYRADINQSVQAVANSFGAFGGRRAGSSGGPGRVLWDPVAGWPGGLFSCGTCLVQWVR